MNKAVAQLFEIKCNRWDSRLSWLSALLFSALGLLIFAGSVFAQTQENLPPPSELKKMRLEDLMNIEVTLVSKRPEKISEAASAIQIITQEDIRRSGATSLPEILRLATNLQVAQINAHDWSITARGFGAALGNNSLANKLLVMIDGRSIYTPLFGGVFWDAQNTLLEDIDRIEVISGPGGTLWGANAVNGVINIVTKSAKDSQGVYASGLGGSFLQDFGGVRYGGKVGSNLFFRLYAQRIDHESTRFANRRDARDAWDMTQGGFRADYSPSAANSFTFQGDFYDGNENEPTNTIVNGQNALGRLRHVFSDKSDLSLQIYFDRTLRKLLTASPNDHFSEDLKTYDFDLQHRFPIGERQSLIWGAGYRLLQDDVHNIASLSFLPARRNLQLFNVFVQNEITIVPDRLKLTLGSKLEHNDFSGFEAQPSARIAWTPSGRQTIWGAVSRAVRSPSRFDSDLLTPGITGDKNFKSEKVVAYELGYRVRPAERLSFSLAAFYNRYNDVRSINLNTAPRSPAVFANDQEAQSWGAELSGNCQATQWWRLRGGYTYLDRKFESKSARVFPGSDRFESEDPDNQFLLQSFMDLPAHFQLDLTARFVDALPATVLSPRIPSYFTFDTRIAWQYKYFEISLVGQNLKEKEHLEFGSAVIGRRIPRSIYGKVTFRR